MSKTPELLPCPFCGGEPSMATEADNRHYVRCLSCAQQFEQTSKDCAAEVWNHRAALQSAADTPAGYRWRGVGEWLYAPHAPEGVDAQALYLAPQMMEPCPTNLEEVAASIGFVLDNKRWEDCSEGFKETCRKCAAAAYRLIREDRL